MASQSISSSGTRGVQYDELHCMGLEIWHDASPGTGWYHLVTALSGCLRRTRLDSGLRKVGMHIMHGTPRKGYFNVLNVDGIYYDEPRLHMNEPIRKAIESHDLVIYQSNFSKAMAERMLGVKARRDAVIYNGTAMKPFRHPVERKPLVVACARWRVNKRPRAIAEAFIRAREDFGVPAAKLVMVGEVAGPLMVAHPDIEYPGDMGHREMRRLFAAARLMVHICHIDSCPNSVVEAVSMGVPALSNNIGGTPELIGSTGTIVPVDREFDFRPITSMDEVGDGSVDTGLLAAAMATAFTGARYVPRPDLSIEKCAQLHITEIARAMQS